jgi:hypothetical protein
MLVLADGMHLDRNTRMLLASYDAKTVEDFFMMGDMDFNQLLAKARTANRGLPPLQIRKVQILRSWLTKLVESHNSSDHGLPWGQDTSEHSDTLLPKDWKRRFKNDLPSLKKKLRSRGDSIFEMIPFLSYLISFCDSICGRGY